MNTQLGISPASLYDTDYQQWLERTVMQLRSRHFDAVDLANLIEELDSLGRSDKRAISSYLMRLCEHLLKIQYWSTERKRCMRGWKVEIANFRIQIAESLESSPSLKPFLNDIFLKQYRNGRRLFLEASGLLPLSIPNEPEFSLEQALDDHWLPLDFLDEESII